MKSENFYIVSLLALTVSIFSSAKSITFNSDITISETHALIVHTADNLVVDATVEDQATITTQATVTGVTSESFPTLLVTESTGTGVSIGRDVIINGDFTVSTGASLEVAGSLIVTGNVLVDAGATVTVQGSAVFDGDGLGATVISGNLVTLHNMTIQNAASSTTHAIEVAGTVQIGGSLEVINSTTNAVDSHVVYINGSMVALGIVRLSGNIATQGKKFYIDTTGEFGGFDITIEGDISLPADMINLGETIGSVGIIGDVSLHGVPFAIPAKFTVIGSFTMINSTVTVDHLNLLGQANKTVFVDSTSSLNSETVQVNAYSTDTGVACEFATGCSITTDELIINNIQSSDDHAVILDGDISVQKNCIVRNNSSSKQGKSGVVHNAGSLTVTDMLLYEGNRSTYDQTDDSMTHGVSIPSSGTASIQSGYTYFKNNKSFNKNSNGVDIGRDIVTIIGLYFDKNKTVSGGTGYGVDLYTTTQSCNDCFITHNTSSQSTQVHYASATLPESIYEIDDAVF